MVGWSDSPRPSLSDRPTIRASDLGAAPRAARPPGRREHGAGPDVARRRGAHRPGVLATVLLRPALHLVRTQRARPGAVRPDAIARLACDVVRRQTGGRAV